MAVQFIMDEFTVLVGKGARMNKYGAKKTEVDGIKFDSKHEAMRYIELKYLQRIGEIRDLELQKSFELLPAQKGEDGKVKERAVRYVADFVYFNKDGNLVVEDAKSKATRTDVYLLKRKMMRYFKGIEIIEV